MSSISMPRVNKIPVEKHFDYKGKNRNIKQFEKKHLQKKETRMVKKQTGQSLRKLFSQ